MSISGSEHIGARGHHSRRRPRPETSRLPSSSSNEPPQWILGEILDLLVSHTGAVTESANTNGCDKNNPSKNCDESNGCYWLLEDISEAKSAQQTVYILKFSDNSGGDIRNSSIDHNNHNNNEWADAMRSGKNRLVLRIWKGGSRWWNLNRNENPLELARSEINGYRVARTAFEEYRSLVERTKKNEAMDDDNNNNNAAPKKRETNTVEMIPWMVPKIPRVLHFHVPQSEESKFEESLSAASTETVAAAAPPPAAPFVLKSLCWAVLEYVGADENDDLTTTDKSGNGGGGDVITESCRCVKIDRSYLEGMIKIRREFGFEEPHPRWGRVPVDEALHYARSILNEVLLPLHHYTNHHYNNQQQHRSSREERHDMAAKTFSGMVKLYRQAWKDVSMAIPLLKHQKLIVNGSKGWDDRIEVCLQNLDGGISFLNGIASSDNDRDNDNDSDNNSSETARIPPLDPVLLHLDLQPQNLIFYETSVAAAARKKLPSVFSVLDWEDAAWGDPRFDLILLCRKVCANRDQADALWSEYANATAATKATTETTNCGDEKDTADDEASKQKQSTTQRTQQNQTMPTLKQQQQQQQQKLLGPIEPWLRLETVHSIATMLLQSMDLVNGGRNPWETKTDLWGKLQREFTRLEGYETCL
jgi:thiamine kinase-like enzyme